MLKSYWRSFAVQLFATLLFALALRTFLFSTYVVLGSSMEDSLHTGDIVLVWKGPQQLARGDVVMLKRSDYDLCLIKRVIALPGEVVEIKGPEVLVNNTPVPQPAAGHPGSYQMGALQVPPDSYFVLGDNRDHSRDSQIFGPFKRDEIVGKAIARLWPLDKVGAIL